MYLPTADPRQRKDITDEFFHYRHLTQAKLWDQYSAYEHWAKIEVIVDDPSDSLTFIEFHSVVRLRQKPSVSYYLFCL